MAFQMTNDNLKKKGANKFEWKQHNDRIEINLFEMSTIGEEKKIERLLNELYSKNIMFSLLIKQHSKYLILYDYTSKRLNAKKRDDLVNHLISSYSLKKPRNMEEIFIPSVRKIEQENNMLQLVLEDNSKLYYLAYLLHSIDSKGQSFKKRFTNYTKNLLQADIFEIVISYLPSFRKNRYTAPNWGIMFIARSKNKEKIQKKKQNFIRFLQSNTVKLNCKLTSVSKKNLVKHQSNFRLLVPWIKQSGTFFEIIDIPKLVKIGKEKREQILLENKVEDIQAVSRGDLSCPDLRRSTINKPFPSIKSLSEINDSQKRKLEQPIKASVSTKKQKMPDEFNPGTLDDLTVSAPRSMNAVFDAEYLKVRISKIFKEFEFKETVIFEDIFDLVLRRGSFYIFTKFFKDVLNQSHAYKIVESLSSIAGLRNDFLCIVVTDVIEEGSRKILNEFNILHLTLSDVLMEDTIKTKIYNTILA